MKRGGGGERLLACLALATLLLGATPSAAFQRETTNDPPCTESDGVNCPHLGKPLAWMKFPVGFFVNSNGSGLSFDDVAAAAEAAFSSWQQASSNGITFDLAGSTSSGANGNDQQNTILWRRLSESRDTFAQSIITFDANTGEISDVDIELNSDFTYAILPAGENDPNDPRVDLQSTVTHEAGHLLGLDHENTRGRQVVMFFSDTTGNTTHRSLLSDDVSGVRAIYRRGGGGGGCTIGAAKRPAELWPAAAVLLLLARRRKRSAGGDD